MSASSTPPEIFNRKRRRALRERAGRRGGNSFLWQRIAEDIADRLADVSRTFEDVLVIGPMAAFGHQILAGRGANITLAALSSAELPLDGGIIIEEDRLPFSPASFDLVICAGTLDSVNDLPGALVQIRRCLQPDGLFLGHMFGAGTLSTLKALLLAAEPDRASPHIHPQIDLRAAADLLTRTGFALPVADMETSRVRYGDWRRLIDDVRDMGVGNALAGPRRYPGRSIVDHLDQLWRARSVNDKVEELFVHLHLSGWAPSADQPKPAKRGSGTVSLASVLPPTKRAA
ncbi:MAG: methyltransferase domain-containing protein [Sphingorhabdus sp.]